MGKWGREKVGAAVFTVFHCFSKSACQFTFSLLNVAFLYTLGLTHFRMFAAQGHGAPSPYAAGLASTLYICSDHTVKQMK